MSECNSVDTFLSLLFTFTEELVELVLLALELCTQGIVVEERTVGELVAVDTFVVVLVVVDTAVVVVERLPPSQHPFSHGTEEELDHQSRQLRLLERWDRDREQQSQLVVAWHDLQRLCACVEISR